MNLVQPGRCMAIAINQIDFRVSKILRFGRTRTQVGFDLYNATNTARPRPTTRPYVPTGQWLTPTAVLTARFAKVSVQFDF